MCDVGFCSELERRLAQVMFPKKPFTMAVQIKGLFRNVFGDM